METTHMDSAATRVNIPMRPVLLRPKVLGPNFGCYFNLQTVVSEKDLEAD